MSTKKTSRKLNSYLWATVKKKFEQFCAHSTLHGAYYFSDNSRWWLRAVWALIVCCSLGLCCFLSHMIWDKFVVDPTLTVVETTHYSTADIPFPAVTVCDTEMVHGPNTGNITNLLTLRGYSQTQISEFYKSFTKVQDKDYAPAAYVRKMHYLLNDLGFPLKNLLEMLRKPCDDIVLECNWRSRPYNCSEMFRSVYTVMGYCCQFDVPYFRTHTTTEANFIAGVQATEALDVIVSGTKMSADGYITNGEMLLYVFDLKDRVTLIDTAIILTPAAYFDVNVYLWAIDSSSYVKALSLKSRKCILDTDPGIGTSFYQGCMTRLILRQVVDQCRCIPFEYSAQELEVEEYVACTWDRLICVYQNIQKMEAEMRDIISQNECYQRCDYVQYETEVEFIKNQRNLSHDRQLFRLRLARSGQPPLRDGTRRRSYHTQDLEEGFRTRPKQLSILSIDKTNMEEIHSRVVVHFSDTTCMKYRREVLYTWDQMLANLGGIFGLCLGGSVVSVIEIIWFLFDLLFTIIHEAFTKKKVDPKVESKEKHRNKIFLINQNGSKEANKAYKTDLKDLNGQKLGKPIGEVRFKFIN